MLGPSFILHSGSICPTWGFCFAGPLSLHCPHPFYFTSFLSFITPLTHTSSSYADTYMYMTCRQDSPEKYIEQDIPKPPTVQDLVIPNSRALPSHLTTTQ
ncbi:hypothetical protein BO86DRAFT_118596 [Aspergillus japonicus CBS 114.51]|uniref:Uncharacterized protein n=1 Tax=Aspergillus japonicus CBS 114.51 TaxID=1448312 RepID=A0A8T8WYU3_ASPJA|nr:hypothetical protein BO86DRAFT_118596 [Aspergillus japonicus CBS 114.51]RAH80951.1 hypothetical protein BO86DRAFT_118596 [Aspergillus japonicus CBS 114.51]